MDEIAKNEFPTLEEQIKRFAQENQQLKLENLRLNEEKKGLSNRLQLQEELIDKLEHLSIFSESASEIAHEINNPLNFVSSSLSIIERGVQDFLKIINMYNQLIGIEEQELYLEIKDLEKEIDIELTKKELIDATSTIKKGLERIHDISHGLSQLGKEETDLSIKFNINESLADTLMLIHEQVNGQIEIRKELGNIPEIISYRGKLNQVFTNIIRNAIEAIQEKETQDNNYLHVQTQFDKGRIIIKIKDTGCGMNNETKDRLFEKFYTTKSFGKGTGLGMGVCKAIIQKHNGEIQFTSEIGIGTEFTIILPLS